MLHSGTYPVDHDLNHQFADVHFHPASGSPNLTDFGLQWPYAQYSYGAETRLVNWGGLYYVSGSPEEFIEPVNCPAPDQTTSSTIPPYSPLPSGDYSGAMPHVATETSGEGSKPPLKAPSASWRCDECKKTFTRKPDLQRHLESTRKHVGKRFPCNECGRSYTRKETLKKHKCVGSAE